MDTNPSGYSRPSPCGGSSPLQASGDLSQLSLTHTLTHPPTHSLTHMTSLHLSKYTTYASHLRLEGNLVQPSLTHDMCSPQPKHLSHDSQNVSRIAAPLKNGSV
eukprot:scaffold244444_cov19-Tisochrysis_lutea.AAC.1